MRILAIVAALVLTTSAAADSLFEPPPRGATAPTPEAPKAAQSSVTLSAFMSYAAIQKIGEAKLPSEVPISGSGKAGCVKLLGDSICADYHWNAVIHKDGPLRIAQGDAAIRVGLPVRVTGKAGVQGDLAHAVKLDGKTFDIHAAPTADFKVEMDRQWRPVLTVSNLSPGVDNAKVEIIGRSCGKMDLGPVVLNSGCIGPVSVGLATLANELLEHKRADIDRAIANAIPGDKIRAQIGEHWRPISVKLPLVDGSPLYLDVTPKSAAVSKLVVGPDGVRLTASLGAETALAPTPAPTDPLPLPPLEKAAPGDGRLQAYLTLVAPYDVLKAQLAERLVGKDFKQTTSVGDVGVHIDDVDLYPSGAGVALGLKVSAKAPTGALDVSGWVYLTGRPVVSDTGTSVKLVDLKYAAVLDNAFWNAAQAALQGPILSEVAARATFDLSSRIDDASSRIADALANADLRGVRMTASKPKIALANVAVGSSGLAASAIVAMTLNLELTAELTGE